MLLANFSDGNLDIDFLGKGIYFVTISNDKKNLTQILEIR